MSEPLSEETTRNLQSATSGFNALFANDLEGARKEFSSEQSPFHSLGAGVCAFMEAAMGMEVSLRSARRIVMMV